LITPAKLSTYSFKHLVELAKARGVPGWHAMRKDELVRAILRRLKSRRRQRSYVSRRRSITPGSSRNGSAVKSKALKKPAGAPGAGLGKKGGGTRRAVHPPARRAIKDLSRSSHGSHSKDRLVVMVRDPYWLHAYWELSRQGVERAQAAIGQEWHSARPVLRLMEVSDGGTTSWIEARVRDIEIHGGVNNWYIDVRDPPKSYRLDVGYLAPSGRFFLLARSNVVSTPPAGASDALDQHWGVVAENYEKIYAMSGGFGKEGAKGELKELFEERLRRPMGAPIVSRHAPGVEAVLPRKRSFWFELDAELLIYGATERTAHVTLQGDPVQLRPDGTFTVRFKLPNCRQVIPAVANSRDGLEQRTIVLAVERNTKEMEPLSRDANEQ
jgi:hypothetical protein